MQATQGDRIIRITLPLAPLLIAILIASLVSIRPAVDQPVVPGPELTLYNLDSGEAVHELFQEELDYRWPPTGPVPPVSIKRFPEDLQSLPVRRMKSVFFRALLPMVLSENQRIRVTREQIASLDRKLSDNPDASLSSEEAERMEAFMAYYRLEGDYRDAATRDRLLRRVDTVPPEMALAQAANESGWGSSRFTREANNLFGEWTWNEDIGLMPQQRKEGATHFVRIFPDLHASVRSYMRNLNTNQAYTLFRELRTQQRQRGQAPDGLRLVAGLERYSERGQDYIHEIRAMIRQNNLDELPDNLRLADD